MNILDTLFGRPQAYGHWAWAGIQQQLHTRTFPQMGCRVCEANGWIPASKPAMSACQDAPDTESTPDATFSYLTQARGKVVNAIADMRLATMDAPTFTAQVALDALNDALAAIEAEIGVFDADE